MRRKIFHRIDEIPKTIIRNYSKFGPMHINNPVVWIFTECCIAPYACGAFFYEDTVKRLLKDIKKNNRLDGVLFWAYRADLVPYDVKIKMSTESFNRNRYMDMLKK